MSARNAPASAAGGQDRQIQEAVDLLKEALAILDANKAPTEIRARLSEVLEALAARSSASSI